MTAIEPYEGCVVKPLPAVRLVGLVDHVPFDQVGPRVGPMFGSVAAILAPLGALGVSIATYEMVPGDLMHVQVGFEWAGDVPDGLVEITLPAVAQAACTLHLGSVDSIYESWQRLHAWARAESDEFAWPSRETYWESANPDMHDWVTELAQPLTR